MAIENIKNNNFINRQTTNPSYSKDEIDLLYKCLFNNSSDFIKKDSMFSKNIAVDFKDFLISFFNLEQINNGLYFAGITSSQGNIIKIEVFSGDEGVLFFEKEQSTGFLVAKYLQNSECKSTKDKDDYIELLNANINQKKKELNSIIKSFFDNKTPVFSNFSCFLKDESLISCDDENIKFYKDLSALSNFFPLNFDKVFALALFSFLTQHCLDTKFDYSVFEFVFKNLKQTLYFQDNIFSNYEWSRRIAEFKEIFLCIEVNESGLLTEESKNLLELNFRQ